ncbi:tRNA (adenosine(37)-N6)-threonylcarbamoyltransferase complex ATPase subunit type 1 TsaE [Pontibacillus litoralis]|uniref:tRNA threonylcarbamoyladenosine biosynthesis protein TsaE n=1 Tax=Pontibacillus litoralis JSM 072002 TaxID=1385512 RepID=A0A0A5FWC9_9BACI|nr:tRNA (adenosine(37)-N6)-threonylcarbamoyltransferase complex ATPase subunit type 1 TsaE [Pontibacillus litoralis]KGX85076.1 ATP-binding protein [Pontibacillus litoralis JSM 072002]
MSQKRIVTTHSPEETQQFAKRLATLLQAGDVITLEGDLGAGKTTFSKGLAKGLGVTRTVNSPTFTIVKEYEGRLPLYHLDVYRLEDSEEDIGFDEYLHGDGVTIVEWAQFIEAFLPDERLNIDIRYEDNTKRCMEIHPKGEHFERICEELKI